ncbi:MAG: zinc ribbon domain-containing protein [Betaproteobacteria bacterium]|nr:zinc ribbon domain-containing protein [Betaproteobacteria bacterium]
MLCTSCGAELEADSSKFCLHCGFTLQIGNSAPAATDPAPAMPAPDENRAVLLTRRKKKSKKSRKKPPLKPLPALLVAPPPRSNSSKDIFSGKNDTLIEPFISSSSTVGTVQNDPEPSIADRKLPPVSLEMDDRILVEKDRIVVEPPYVWSPPISTQVIRERIQPAMLGVAVAIVVVFLGLFLWWGSEKSDPFQEEASAPPPLTQPSEPLRGTEPSLPLFVPAPQTKGALASNPETASEYEPELISIPSLPMNQRQGRHNSTEIRSEHALPTHQSAGVETATQARIANTPAPAPVETSTNPPWLGQMRKDLSKCPNFYCRMMVREQYCASQWESLPECKDASL